MSPVLKSQCSRAILLLGARYQATTVFSLFCPKQLQRIENLCLFWSRFCTSLTLGYTTFVATGVKRWLHNSITQNYWYNLNFEKRGAFSVINFSLIFEFLKSDFRLWYSLEKMRLWFSKKFIFPKRENWLSNFFEKVNFADKNLQKREFRNFSTKWKCHVFDLDFLR